MVKKASVLGRGKLTERDGRIATLLEEGKKPKVIAEIVGCSVQNVYNRIRIMGEYVKKGISTEHAVVIARKQIDFANQLLKVAESADRLLDELSEALRTKEQHLELAENIETKVAIRQGGRADQEMLLKTISEIRNQVTIWHNIRKDLFSMQQVSEAFNEIIEVIGELEPDARAKIVKRLRQKGLSEGLVQ